MQQYIEPFYNYHKFSIEKQHKSSQAENSRVEANFISSIWQFNHPFSYNLSVHLHTS